MAKRLEIFIDDDMIKFNNRGFSELELLGIADLIKLNVYDRIRIPKVTSIESTETIEGEKENG